MRILVTLIPVAALAACVAPAPPPPPAPAVATPTPAAPPPVIAAGSDWRDWPLTPGDWSYAPDARGSVARFGRAGAAPALTLRCDRAARTVTLARAAEPGAAPTATIRTSSTARALTLQPGADGATATLAASDPLFDAMGFSRGRFVVQQPGGTTLVAPAWAEILRVAEDCRG